MYIAILILLWFFIGQASAALLHLAISDYGNNIIPKKQWRIIYIIVSVGGLISVAIGTIAFFIICCYFGVKTLWNNFED